jgi:uncharacterized protein with HEPN domain
MSPRVNIERINDILNAIVHIRSAELLISESEIILDFHKTEIGFDAILYNLLIIGEAIKNLDKQFIKQYPTIEWQKIGRLRDLLAHQYFRIELLKIREYIDEPLTNLELICLSVLVE